MDEHNTNLNPRGRGDDTVRRPLSQRGVGDGGGGGGAGGAHVDPLDLYFDGELPRLSKPVREALRGSPERRRELDETRKVLAELGREPECPDFTLSVLDAVDARRPFLSQKSRRLVTWSRVAVAACVVLAAGAVAVASRLSPGITDGAAPIADLERGVTLDAERASGWSSITTQAAVSVSPAGASRDVAVGVLASGSMSGGETTKSRGLSTVASAQPQYASAGTHLTNVTINNRDGGSRQPVAIKLEPGPRVLAVSPEMSAQFQKLALAWNVSDTRVVRVTNTNAPNPESMSLILAGGSGGELLVDEAWVEAERARLAAGVRPNLLRDGNSACMTVRGVLQFDAMGGEIASLQSAAVAHGFEMRSSTLVRPTGRGFVPVAGVSAEWREPWTPSSP